MSALTARGSTRRWREIRAWVLHRDRYRCRAIVDDHRCGARATTVGHIIRREHGGSDAVSNLRAECAGCNYGERTQAVACAPERLSLAQAAIVTALDVVGLPVSVGWRRAAPALAATLPGTRLVRADITAACRWRRARGPLTRL